MENGSAHSFGTRSPHSCFNPSMFISNRSPCKNSVSLVIYPLCLFTFIGGHCLVQLLSTLPGTAKPSSFPSGFTPHCSRTFPGVPLRPEKRPSGPAAQGSPPPLPNCTAAAWGSLLCVPLMPCLFHVPLPQGFILYLSPGLLWCTPADWVRQGLPRKAFPNPCRLMSFHFKGLSQGPSHFISELYLCSHLP